MSGLTLESRLKRELTIGTHVVALSKNGATRRVIVTIGKRGKVTLLPMPDAGDMYTSGARVKGDALQWGEGPVIVWAARDPSFLAQFQGEAVPICLDEQLAA